MITASPLTGSKRTSPDRITSDKHTPRRKLYDTSSRHDKQPTRERSYKERDEEYGISLESMFKSSIMLYL